MPKYRKKPVVIEAVQIKTEAEAARTPGICLGACRGLRYDGDCWPHVHTLEGEHAWTPGDWLITGVKGERYFCKPDVFEQTYERVDE